MIVTRSVFAGEHRGRPATVTFQHVPCGWKVTMTVAGKTVTAQSSKSVKPCMTHAGYLLDEHFPLPLDAGYRKLRGKEKTANAHAARVVESSFVEHKTGVRLRVVK